MTAFWTALIVLVVLLIAAFAVSAIAACMLSSQISRRLGEDEYSQFIKSQENNS